jgi:hypothetical protein
MMGFCQDTNPGTTSNIFSAGHRRADLPETTEGSQGETKGFLFLGESDLVGQAREVVSEIANKSLARQTETLLSTIQGEIRSLKQKSHGLSDIPPLRAHIEKDGSVLLEWIFPDFRIGFNIEPNPEDSGWHFVTNKRTGDETGSGPLLDVAGTIRRFVRFICLNT